VAVSGIPFVTMADPRYGQVTQLSPLVRRIIADNPSKFTYHGTGVYIVGEPGGRVAVIDPGPLNDHHRDALAAALADDQVVAILVTHCHADHSPLAAWLRGHTGAPTVGFGPHGEVDLNDSEIPVEESIDTAFTPDVVVADGDVAATGEGWTLRAVHTPGHTSNHLCFELPEDRALFTGDHVMGWSTTVIAPPDGDMRAYIDSLRKVAARGDRVLYPTHGAPVTEPEPFVLALIEHRLAREAQVLRCVRDGVGEIGAIVQRLYADVRPELHQPAARSVLAHLVKLVDDGMVTCDGVPTLTSAFAAA
jgi:glyoxylase-like metal-dependent hydrolase (beta-lactamase superfamily II)